MYTAVGNLLARAQAAGAVRNDITARDIFQIFEMLHAIYTGDTTRREALRRRYLQLIAPALAAPAAAPLTEPPPPGRRPLQHGTLLTQTTPDCR